MRRKVGRPPKIMPRRPDGAVDLKKYKRDYMKAYRLKQKLKGAEE